eukprot:scaffold6789_cov206-Skeletonema_marinoi.AAC.4
MDRRREGQQTNGAVPFMSAFRLLEQKFVPQFGRSFLALLFVLSPVLPLAFHTAISNEMAGDTFPQLDVIHFCDAAGSATH